MKAYQLGLYEKAMPGNLTWEEKLHTAGEAGYDYVEISIDETEEKLNRLNWTKEKRLALVEQMYQVGTPIRSMCLSGHRKYPLGSEDSVIFARGMEIMKKAIELADDLGIRTIQLAGYDVYYEKGSESTRRRFARNLKEAVDIAAAYGITLGFETMETDFMNTCEKAMHYVKQMKSSYLGVYPDSGNINNAALDGGGDVLEDLKSCQAHVVALHLKETTPGVYRDMKYGQGKVDFESMIGAAWRLGIRRYVAEFWYLGQEKWKEELTSACQFLREFLDCESRSMLL